jgi:hypothetical protein
MSGIIDGVPRRMVELLTNAFGLVTALAWSDAVKSLFAENGVLRVATNFGPWVYAVGLTCLVYLLTQMTFFAKYAKPTCTSLCDASVTAIKTAVKDAAADVAANTRRERKPRPYAF